MAQKKKIDWLNHGLEFIIVVVGILLAFQLNTWSEEKKQRAILKEHMHGIQDETVFNLANVKRSIDYGKIEIENIDSMLFLIRQGDNIPAINAMAFKLLKVGRVYLQKNSYNTLTASGDIRHIQDFELKEDIINLYEYYAWTESTDKINLEFYIQNYYPYIMNNFDMLNGSLQAKELYTSQLFKNILSGYKYQIMMRTNKYKDCHKEIVAFLYKRQWTPHSTDNQN